MYRKIDHIGIAVRSMDDALRSFVGKLGLSLERVEEVQTQETRVATLPVGESRLELLEATSADSPVAKFIARHGEGLHHVCLQVEDIVSEVGRLRSAGVRMIDDAPRPGAGGCLIAFVHPSETAGVLIELSQPGKSV